MFALLGMKFLPFALIGLVALAAGGWGGYRIGEANYDKLRAQDAINAATALAAAVQRQRDFDKVSIDEANQQAQAQAEIAAQASASQQAIVRYINVPVTKVISSTCIPVGLLRVLSDAARGNARRLSFPAGQSDAACTRLDWPTFAGRLVADYAIARANKALADGWQDWWGKVKVESTGAPLPQPVK